MEPFPFSETLKHTLNISMRRRVASILVHPQRSRYCISAEPGVLAILVRHASTEMNDPRHPRVRGWEDVPLSPEGRIEAQLTARKLRKYNPQYIFHSDFMRDSETAHILATCLNLPTEADFAARTWDVGRFSGHLEQDVESAILRLYRQPWERPPGSTESFNEFAMRFVDFMEDKLEMAAQVSMMRPIIIVTHGRCLALAESHFEGVPTWKAHMPLPAGFALVTVADDRTLGLEFVGRREPVMKDT